MFVTGRRQPSLRHCSCLVLFYQSLHGQTAIPLPYHYMDSSCSFTRSLHGHTAVPLPDHYVGRQLFLYQIITWADSCSFTRSLRGQTAVPLPDHYMNRQLFLYKIITWTDSCSFTRSLHGQTAVSLPDHYMGRQLFLYQIITWAYSCSFTRSLHEQTAVPLPNHLVRTNNNTRGHINRFIQVPTRTQVYANSFFNRIVKNWNGLSETVVSAVTGQGQSAPLDTLIYLETVFVS